MSGQQEEPVLIGELVMNERERLRVRLTSLDGQRVIDLRVYAEETPGAFTEATHKGFGIQPDLLRQLRHLLEEADRRAAMEARRLRNSEAR